VSRVSLQRKLFHARIHFRFALVATYGNEQGKLAGHLTSMTLYTKSGNKVLIDLSQTMSRTDVDGTSKIYMNGSKVKLSYAACAARVTSQLPTFHRWTCPLKWMASRSLESDPK
jgi:hypothetical protein